MEFVGCKVECLQIIKRGAISDVSTNVHRMRTLFVALGNI